MADDSVRILEDNADRFRTELAEATDAALEKIGLTAERYAKAECPVDTGRLRNSITHVVDGKKVYVGTDVEYGQYVEMGTSRTKAQPFLVPAARGHSDTYRKIIQSELS